MGCFGSREDARRKVFESDWHGCDYGFIVGSVTGVTGFCPLDKLTINFLGAEKEITEHIGEFNEQKLDEVKSKDLGKKVFEALKELHKMLSDKYKDGTTAGEVMGRYTGTEAIKQVDECLKTFCEKAGLDHKWPEEAAAATGMEGMDKGEMEAMMEEMAAMEMGGEEMAAEGGEEMMEGEAMAAMEMGDGEAKAPAGESKLFDVAAFEAVSGHVELPKLVVQLMVQYPVFGDAVKAQVMHHDLGGDAPFNSFGPAAALAGAYVAAKQEGAVESWGSSWLTKDDLDDLTEVSKDGDNKALIFPGVVKAYTSQDLAKGTEEVKDRTQVLFKFNGKAFQPAGPNMNVFFRTFAKVDKLTEPAGDVKHYVCELSDFTKYAFATVKEYYAGVEGAVAAAKGAVDAVMGDNKEMEAPQMEEEKAMEDPPAMDMAAEMMDPPAE